MTSRNDVYAALDSERDYQDMRKSRDQGQEFHSVEEFLLYMEDYLHEARNVASRTWGPEAKPKTLEVLRKVTALGVACMEIHGAPQRAGFERDRDQPTRPVEHRPNSETYDANSTLTREPVWTPPQPGEPLGPDDDEIPF